MTELNKEDIKLLRQGLRILRNSRGGLPKEVMKGFMSEISNGDPDAMKAVDDHYKKEQDAQQRLENQIVLLEAKLVTIEGELAVGDALSDIGKEEA